MKSVLKGLVESFRNEIIVDIIGMTRIDDLIFTFFSNTPYFPCYHSL